MAFEKTTSPYEILFRFNPDGSIKGAHIGFLETVTEDGNIISQQQKNVESVAVAGALGFPLQEVGTIIDTALQQDCNNKAAVITELNIALSDKDTEIQTLTDEVNSLKKEISQLRQSSAGA